MLTVRSDTEEPSLWRGRITGARSDSFVSFMTNATDLASGSALHDGDEDMAWSSYCIGATSHTGSYSCVSGA